MRYIHCVRFDRAIKHFGGATKLRPVEQLVDEVYLPFTEAHRRKVERLGSVQRAEYLAEREAKRSALIHEENEKRRLRALLAESSLLRIHVHLNQFDEARRSLERMFELCAHDDELFTARLFCHITLKEISAVSMNMAHHHHDGDEQYMNACICCAGDGQAGAVSRSSGAQRERRSSR